MKDNAVGLIVVGLLAFLAIAVTGKWLLEKRDRPRRDDMCAPRQVMAQPQPTPPAPQPQPTQPQVIVVPPAQPAPQQPPVIVLPPQYPHHAPNCHGNRDFWMGYRDGYTGAFPRNPCPEYNQGYQIGTYDRRLGRPYYYDRYFREPGSGFSLRLPGFRLDIR